MLAWPLARQASCGLIPRLTSLNACSPGSLARPGLLWPHPGVRFYTLLTLRRWQQIPTPKMASAVRNLKATTFCPGVWLEQIWKPWTLSSTMLTGFCLGRSRISGLLPVSRRRYHRYAVWAYHVPGHPPVAKFHFGFIKGLQDRVLDSKVD